MALCALASVAAGAQPVLDVTEELAFDRPEAWAMRRFAAVIQPTPGGAPEERPPWSFELSLEAGWVPSLSEEERRVGFGGIKEEALNRTAIFGRPRLTVGLPAGISASVAWLPPVELDGVEPDVVSLELARSLWRAEVGSATVSVGLRLFGQRGTLTGDIVCDRATVDAGDDPRANPFGCERPSRDELEIEQLGAELAAAVEVGRWRPFLAVARSRLDAEFQIDARYGGLVDRTLQRTEGYDTSWSAGIGVRLAPGLQLTCELLYVPLTVERPTGDPPVPVTVTPGERRDDDLLTVRALIAYRWR